MLGLQTAGGSNAWPANRLSNAWSAIRLMLGLQTSKCLNANQQMLGLRYCNCLVCKSVNAWSANIVCKCAKQLAGRNSAPKRKIWLQKTRIWIQKTPKKYFFPASSPLWTFSGVLGLFGPRAFSGPYLASCALAGFLAFFKLFLWPGLFCAFSGLLSLFWGSGTSVGTDFGALQTLIKGFGCRVQILGTSYSSGLGRLQRGFNPLKPLPIILLSIGFCAAMT